jgi:hypothetical protein
VEVGASAGELSSNGKPDALVGSCHERCSCSLCCHLLWFLSKIKVIAGVEWAVLLRGVWQIHKNTVEGAMSLLSALGHEHAMTALVVMVGEQVRKQRKNRK